jgi:threonylcarbamoyladenosine tRNA methylthiotransferase MtaB
MTTFKIYELGCKVNQYESQVMREQLKRAGFTEANGSPADIYVVNTCTVTASADSQSRNLIRRSLRENLQAKVIVAGCYVQKDSKDILEICKDAILIRNKQKDKIVDFLTDSRRTASTADILDFHGHNRAFVKIEDGCNNNCSYCKVPLVRGRAVSRPAEDIIKEASNLAAAGFKEIVLCGICLGAYKDLIGLIGRLERIKGIKRIRLSSIEPIYVTEDLIERIVSSDKVCRHLHIPLQSGDDRILKAMNRRYTAAGYIKMIDGIRKRMPQAAIATDVLVGFNGEGEKEFKNTLKTIRAVRPMRTHIFTYSPREGTTAFDMPGMVDKKESSRRLDVLKRVTEGFSVSYRKRFTDKIVQVLAEGRRDKRTGLLTGYTDTYVKVLFDGPDAMINELVKVKIAKVSSDSTIGRLYTC